MSRLVLDESFVMADLLDEVTSDIEPRIMIDVGAHHGSAFSPFVSRGWLVHAFEPDPENRQFLTDRFGSNPQVTIDPRAVSNRAHTHQTLYKSTLSSGISTLSPFHPSHTPSGTVETVTLDLYCRTMELSDVHYLKVDTEGHEFFVLAGFAWERYAPTGVMCEFEDGKTRRLGYSANDLAAFLQEHGYGVWVSQWHPIVEYGGPHRWKSFDRYGESVIDEESWGNLLAFRPEIGEATVAGVVSQRLKSV